MHALRSLRILVVEDELIIAAELQIIMENEGAEVFIAPDVRSARALLLDRPAIDLAVLDVRVSDGDTLGLAEELAGKGIPFIFHSGHADPAGLRQRFPGAMALSKPAAPDTIVSAAHQVAQGR